MIWHFPPVSRFEGHSPVRRIISIWYANMQFARLHRLPSAGVTDIRFAKAIRIYIERPALCWSTFDRLRLINNFSTSRNLDILNIIADRWFQKSTFRCTGCWIAKQLSNKMAFNRLWFEFTKKKKKKKKNVNKYRYLALTLQLSNIHIAQVSELCQSRYKIFPRL